MDKVCKLTLYLRDGTKQGFVLDYYVLSKVIDQLVHSNTMRFVHIMGTGIRIDDIVAYHEEDFDGKPNILNVS